MLDTLAVSARNVWEMTAEKQALRSVVLARRRALSPAALAAAASAVRAHLLAGLVGRDLTMVCGYVPIGPEPGSVQLLDDLAAAGRTVLVPVLRPDLDLDWATYSGPSGLRPGLRGVPEPTGRRLGVRTVAAAQLLLVPAVAVDRSGGRLGRGGGSYDRALRRVAGDRPVVALLHDGELLPAGAVPVATHDRSVTHVITPTGGWVPVGAGTAGPGRPGGDRSLGL